MEPRLVFVHGIGGPRQAEGERVLWTQALATGARLAGHTDLADALTAGRIPTRFLVYRDLYDEAGAQGGADLGLDEAEERLLHALMLEVIDELDDGETLDDPDAWAFQQARLQLVGAGQAQGLGSLGRSVVNAATTLLSAAPLRRSGQWASGRLMVAALAQVARYLGRGEPDAAGATLDQRIRSRIAEALTPSTIVIAHSLGTVVSFEALHEARASTPLFVTLGSPIGMRTVVLPRLRPQPPSTPDGVGQWLNFWDRDDLIVARSDIERDVLANAAGVAPISRRVDSDGLWVHTATKYLAQPAVAGPIAEAAAALGRGSSS